MAIIQTAAASSGSAVVDPTFQSIRVSERPPEILGSYQIALISGLLTGVAAGGTVYSLRWSPSVSTNLCMIRRVEIGVATTTAFTAAQSLQYSMTIARAFTSNDSGGLSAALAQANTGTMTAVARTLDSFPIAYVATGGTAAAPIPTIMPITPIYQHQAGDYPLILANNEGFVILNTITMGAAGVINLTVNVEWMELSATSGNVISY
jgi:hypothetical protein